MNFFVGGSILLQMTVVESKRKIMQNSLKCTREEADSLVAAARDKHDFILFVKSNSFRQK